jgi:hypothetical protein
MSQRDLHRYHTLKLALEHRITVAQAGVSLGLSPRQIWRLKARLRAEGRRAVLHGHRGHPSPRRLDPVIREQILALARGRYAGLHTTHLNEKLQTNERLAVSRPTVERLLTAPGAPAF